MEKREIIDLMLSRLNRDTDLSWDEIANRTGMNISDSHIRKMAYGVKFYDDYLREEELLDNKDVNEFEKIKEKTIELKKLDNYYLMKEPM